MKRRYGAGIGLQEKSKQIVQHLCTVPNFASEGTYNVIHTSAVTDIEVTVNTTKQLLNSKSDMEVEITA